MCSACKHSLAVYRVLYKCVLCKFVLCKRVLCMCVFVCVCSASLDSTRVCSACVCFASVCSACKRLLALYSVLCKCVLCKCVLCMYVFALHVWTLHVFALLATYQFKDFKYKLRIHLPVSVNPACIGAAVVALPEGTLGGRKRCCSVCQDAYKHHARPARLCTLHVRALRIYKLLRRINS